MEHFGVRGIPLKWFESYLSNRKQYVSVNGHTSDKLQVTPGVPQGSVLGPLLFLIFVNDLPNVSKFLQFYLFADDTNIYYESSDLLNLLKILNRELSKVRKWLEANRLALNIEKTNFVLFHSSQRKLTQTIVLKIEKNKIKQGTHVRFLGVLLDSTLSWRYHLTELSKKPLCSTRYSFAFVSCHFCIFSYIWCVCVGSYISIFVKSNVCVTKENSQGHNI